MKTLTENPPEWIMQGCMSKFRVDPKHTVWTYGNTLYNPGGIYVPDHLMAHEQTHSVQQERYRAPEAPSTVNLATVKTAFDHAAGDGPDGWWKRYLIDPEFRLEQELQAYAMQYAFYCQGHKDRNDRFRFALQLARSLSGPLYQLPITLGDARKAIQETAAALQPTLV